MANRLTIEDFFISEVTWIEFKKFLDGTYATLQFTFETSSTFDYYTIITEEYGGFYHKFSLQFSDVADKADFDTNFAPLPARSPKSATIASSTSIPSSVTSVTLLASNSSRKTALFFNDATKPLFLKFGAVASSSSYTVKILSQGYFEMPIPCIYTGKIDGIWPASVTGNVLITEI